MFVFITFNTRQNGLSLVDLRKQEECYVMWFMTVNMKNKELKANECTRKSIKVIYFKPFILNFYGIKGVFNGKDDLQGNFIMSFEMGIEFKYAPVLFPRFRERSHIT